MVSLDPISAILRILCLVLVFARVPLDVCRLLYRLLLLLLGPMMMLEVGLHVEELLHDEELLLAHHVLLELTHEAVPLVLPHEAVPLVLPHEAVLLVMVEVGPSNRELS
jgi:hypothetical protein